MSKLSLVLVFTISTSMLAQTKPAASPKAAAAKPAQATANPKAVIHTSAGDLRCTLFPDKTPKTVENFIGLATGTKDWTSPVSHAKKHGVPLYDGTVFHRVIPNFMIQGGDPAGNGSGDPGYTFADEIRPELKFDQPGRLAMANSGPNTNGSQFFITETVTPHLNGGYTLFGQCDAATVALVKQIARRGRDPKDDRPFNPVRIVHIDIVKPGAAAKAPVVHRKAVAKPRSSTK
jgi:peptidyl-prolyl cis-trans isomerase A (cyclophilin A)